MNRRKILLSAGGVATTGMLPGPASALLNCTPFYPNGLQRCQVGIDSNVIGIAALNTGPQEQSQWCWAACIAMVFQYYGHAIKQQRIVSETWGSIKNLPAQPHDILENLNRPWVNDMGGNFRVTGDVFSATHMTAAQDLSQNMPLIIGTTGHAMVLSSLVYDRNMSAQGEVVNAIVRDPWPGRGQRSLTTAEWLNANFLVRIRAA